jgi:hyperosmotically inducible periplasmic protein
MHTDDPVASATTENPMRHQLFMTVALAAMLGAHSAGAQQPDSAAQEQARSRMRLFERIENEVFLYPHYTLFDFVSVQINDGAVIVTGRVTMPYKSEDIAKRIAKIKGVTNVENRLEVLPASKSDDELRVRIADAIYGHRTFQPYAAQAHPPIHVIVERGRVTLEGVVQDESERLLALSLAGSRGALQLKSNLLTVKEARGNAGAR